MKSNQNNGTEAGQKSEAEMAARSRKAVARYIAVLFVSALLLIVMSYFMHNRSQPQARFDTDYYSGLQADGFDVEGTA